MSMFHPKTNAFDRKMKALFDEIDEELEESYGAIYPLHPNRPERGATGNNSADGLFNVGVYFTPGYGSEKGRGYMVDFKISTLQKVDPRVRELLLEEISEKIREKLPKWFPYRNLQCTRDGEHYKIIGDFTLGSL